MLMSTSLQQNLRANCFNVVERYNAIDRGYGSCSSRRAWRTTRCKSDGPVSRSVKEQQARAAKESSNGSVVADRKRDNRVLSEEKRLVSEELEGLPRWFSPEVTASPNDIPVMFYLPGMDSSGYGLHLHHESLARLFELRCLHASSRDRTPFPALLEMVETAVIEEARRRPRRPIYLVGEGFGGALALAIAARNPELDLLLILANPATSFRYSQLNSLVPLLSNLPWDHVFGAPSLVNFIFGRPSEMAQEKVPASSADVALSKDILLWKVKMLQEAANYANSRLHAVKAEVLVLASENDRLFPSSSEADKLKKLIKGCRTRKYPQSGHNLLQEGEFDLATVIKAVGCYRQSNKWDPVMDYVKVTEQEVETHFDKNVKLFKQLTSPVFFSTSLEGARVQSLAHIPTSHPIMLVGYHMLLGLELGVLIHEVYRAKNVLLRGLAHPGVVGREYEGERQPDPAHGDAARLFGAVPASGRSIWRLLKGGHSTLLYPGGTREALHRKGEEYKLFWPEKSEFVRMAVRHGATIIPFGGIGEDDMFDIALDLNDLRKNQVLLDLLTPRDMPLLRQELGGELADQAMHLPVCVPKGIPRFYYLMQKPIVTAGREDEFRDKRKVDELYRHVKSEVETAMEYLKEKREEDPYRHFLPRMLYESPLGWNHQAPTFKP